MIAAVIGDLILDDQAQPIRGAGRRQRGVEPRQAVIAYDTLHLAQGVRAKAGFLAGMAVGWRRLVGGGERRRQHEQRHGHQRDTQLLGGEPASRPPLMEHGVTRGPHHDDDEAEGDQLQRDELGAPQDARDDVPRSGGRRPPPARRTRRRCARARRGRGENRRRKARCDRADRTRSGLWRTPARHDRAPARANSSARSRRAEASVGETSGVIAAGLRNAAVRTPEPMEGEAAPAGTARIVPQHPSSATAPHARPVRIEVVKVVGEQRDRRQRCAGGDRRLVELTPTVRVNAVCS